MKRKQAIKNLSLGVLSLSGLPALAKMLSNNKVTPDLSAEKKITSTLKNNIHHSVCRWTFAEQNLDELCEIVKTIGFHAIDLIEPKDFPILQKHNIYSSMCTGAHISLTEGWNDPKYHTQLIKNYTQFIPIIAENGYKNLICFSGNRNGKTDQEGLENCAKGLSQLMPLAEKHDVVIQMELFNSKVNHPDYMADSTKFGVDLCKKLGSANFKLLYDIYHMQIMEGDIIHTIQTYYPYFGHYHTAGVPGRNEIGDNQELNYKAIMQAILKTGFQGYVAQEFIALNADKKQSLTEAIFICDV